MKICWSSIQNKLLLTFDRSIEFIVFEYFFLFRFQVLKIVQHSFNQKIVFKYIFKNLLFSIQSKPLLSFNRPLYILSSSPQCFSSFFRNHFLENLHRSARPRVRKIWIQQQRARASNLSNHRSKKFTFYLHLISSDRSSYSDGGLSYIYVYVRSHFLRFLFPPFSLFYIYTSAATF